jgi:sugar/nucleoside kinase (ribokinase family)
MEYDVTAIGNAIVDVISQTDDAFLKKHRLRKGAMTLIDAATAERIYGLMGPGVETSGGSAANTAFVGKVAADQLGDVFRHDIQAAGVAFDTAPHESASVSTARSLILVTPDGHRTMQTFLGAAGDVGPGDVEGKLIVDSKVLYLEGYLWDQPIAREAFLKAARLASAAGRKVSFTLSDPFCVDRHRQEFVDFIENHVDLLFANEEEIKSLYQVDDFDMALQRVAGQCEVAALTRSEKGSVIAGDEEVHVIDAEKVAKVVDTTGAGDAYAAGFLYAYTHGSDLRACGRLGGLMAAEIISHYGARAEADLKMLAAGLL